jgi:O-antigen ligase
MLAAYYAFKKISLNYFFDILYKLFIFINFIITILVFYVNRTNLQDLFTVRFGLSSDDDERVYLNAITIGISSITLLFLILYKKNNKYFILFPSLVSCFINLLISGSLGPLLALLLTFTLFLFFRFRYFYILFLILLLLLIIFSFNFYNDELSNNFILLSRVLQGSEAETVSTRSDLINQALNQFKGGIFFGTHYFTIKNYSSPHNLLIDILLATGIFGLIFFLIPLFNIFKSIFKNYLKSPIFPLFFMHLILTQTSGYVFGASDFFIFMSIILSISSNKKINFDRA